MHFSDNCCGEQFFFTRVVVLIFSLIRVLCAVLYRSVWGSLFPFPSNYKQHALGLFPSLCPPHTPTQLQSVEDHLPARNLRVFSQSPHRRHRHLRARTGAVFATAQTCARATHRPRQPPTKVATGLVGSGRASAGANGGGLHFPTGGGIRSQRDWGKRIRTSPDALRERPVAACRRLEDAGTSGREA